MLDGDLPAFLTAFRPELTCLYFEMTLELHFPLAWEDRPC